MNLGRKDAPPPRPPAPKLSLGKIRGKQHSTGSIAIRFSAATLDDDYGLDEVTIETRPRKPLSCENSVLDEEDDHQSSVVPDLPHSKSAPASGHTTPISPFKEKRGSMKPEAKNETSFSKTGSSSSTPAGEKSILSGIKEKLGDKMPDPLTALIDKIEELAQGDTHADEKKLRKGESFDERKLLLKKSESLESTRSLKVYSERRDSFLNSRSPSHSRNPSVDSEQSLGEKVEKEAHTDVQYAEKSLVSRTESFEIVDDFYCTEEPFEDFSGGIILESLSRSPSGEVKSGSSAHGPKAKLQKLIKSREKSGNSGKPVSMTLSGLLSNNKLNVDEEYLGGDEEDEFFDPEEDLSHRKKATPTSRLDKFDNLQKQYEARPSISYNKWMITGAVCLIAYLIIPLPTFISGMILGGTVVWVCMMIYSWFTAPAQPQEPFILPDLTTLSPLEVPEMRESKNEDGKFKVSCI